MYNNYHKYYFFENRYFLLFLFWLVIGLGFMAIMQTHIYMDSDLTKIYDNNRNLV